MIKVLSLRDNIVVEIEESKMQLEGNDIDSLSQSTGIEARYTILENRDKLLQIIPSLYEQKSKYDEQINSIKDDLKNAQRLSSDLKVMLQEVKEQLTLQDIINSQASKQVECTFDEQIDELLCKIGKLDAVRSELFEEIGQYNDRKRTKEINENFKDYLRFAQSKLGIKDPKVGTILQYNSISKSETGSRAPRAILAYHYALLKTIEDRSTNPMLPVVIDSPKQQDPDAHTTKKLLDLCVDGLSTSSQLIVGSVSFDRSTDGFKILTMTDKYSLLKTNLYSEVYEEIMPLYQHFDIN